MHVCVKAFLSLPSSKKAIEEGTSTHLARGRGKKGCSRSHGRPLTHTSGLFSANLTEAPKIAFGVVERERGEEGTAVEIVLM